MSIYHEGQQCVPRESMGGIKLVRCQQEAEHAGGPAGGAGGGGAPPAAVRGYAHACTADQRPPPRRRKRHHGTLAVVIHAGTSCPDGYRLGTFLYTALAFMELDLVSTWLVSAVPRPKP